MNFLSYVGTLAAFCTTTSFIPQIVKIKKQGGEDLSYPMLFLYLSGVLLWLVYGLLLHAAAIIWANAITSFLVALAIALKATSQPLREIAGTDNDSLAEPE
jgi:MtN3 and saliva related transmembrane protein